MTSLRLAAILLFSAGTAAAADWYDSIGVHAFDVPQAGSETFGINVSGEFDKHTPSGRHYFGSADLFLDHDKDDLDPDHIPIWWQLHAGTDGTFASSGAAHFGWTADVDTRMNTVSSIERRIEALPALVGAYDGDRFHGSLKTGAGWFFLEIDDDVPKTRGYERGEFRNSELGYMAEADASVKLGESWSISGMAQEWWDSHQSLQSEYKAELRVDTSHWRKGSSFVMSADYTEYNLDVYAIPGLPAILPWDHDVLFRLTLDKAW